ncbi:hypothetical protein CLV59_105337 [Chitinophaga dinghuensis]|uniref:YD repeat-containing protein n=1 Tax=Chitinophaga dinghuensis TaxID=1539050 RepID=A0A327VWB1_9BACT|nr:hypothetical protein [Chitinophaga dinghuensis]RAJ80229.1 hypothetical protein CLV59_105337 [Chitinophaga dinghuensis]
MSKYIIYSFLLSALIFSACKKDQRSTADNTVTPATSQQTIDHKGQALTPVGWVPQSQVHHIETGEYLSGEGNRLRRYDRNGKVLEDYGALEQNARQTPFYPDNAKGKGVLPLGSGWITYTYWSNSTSSAINYFNTNWTVPPAPAVNSGQTIFLFNGIQNSDHILQPVLQWGPSAAGGGAYWAIANWYVGNNAVYSSLIPVSPGTNLQGVMTLLSLNSTGTKGNYTSAFNGYPSITLTVNNIPTLYWAAESLEAYGVQTCSNYPNTTSTRLSGIDLRVGGSQAPLSWTVANAVTDCGQHANVVTPGTPNGIVDIYY